ncbi:MAG: DNA polymerase III subunit [Aquificae bacterium]|nr:DNA polymerase III subunit [Aquificota bacterium]
MKVIGHENTRKIIRQYLDRDYSTYQLLFEGKDCIGKKLVALLTARAYLCEKDYGFGCGECKSCRMVNNTIDRIYGRDGGEKNPHPDLMVVSPEREIRIDQIRQVIDFLKLKKKKAVIIEKAERMNLEASNALLKTLEEPPENSLIVLTTSNQAKLLPTIVSRCKKIRFAPLSREEVWQILQLQGKEGEDLKTLVALSDGSMCVPSAIAESPELLKYAKDLFMLLTVEGVHPEGIISFGEIFERLDNDRINLLLDIVEKIIYKKMLKGEVDPELFNRFIYENKGLKKAIEKGVKKKLAVEGMYFNLKT